MFNRLIGLIFLAIVLLPSYGNTTPNVFVDGYARSEFKHWTDEDNDGENTRQEVLKEEQRTDGTWKCPWTGHVSNNPRHYDVDHTVPLAYAYRAGAENWGASKKQAFANDLDYPDALVAMYYKDNRRKGAKGPSKWLPPNNICRYINAWETIIEKWELTPNKKDREVMDDIMRGCK